MQKQVTREHVTVKSGTQTNSTESVTNGFQQNEEGCHRPRGPTRLEQTHKFHSLAFYTNESNRTLQSNTHPQSKPCLSSNSRTKGHQSKRVASQNNKEEHGEPYYSRFALVFRKTPPSSRQTISLRTLISRSRTCTQLTPLQMHTFQSLSIPKTAHRLTKTRKSTVSSLCSEMVIRMISDQYLLYNSTTNCPNVNTQHRSHKRLMEGYEGHRRPCLSCRCENKRKKDIHYY